MPFPAHSQYKYYCVLLQFKHFAFTSNFLPLSFLLSSTPTAPLSLAPPFLAAASTWGRAPAAQIW